MNKSIDVIGVQMDFGASKRGVAMGPAAIRYAGLLDDLKGMGFDVHDKGDILRSFGAKPRRPCEITSRSST